MILSVMSMIVSFVGIFFLVAELFEVCSAVSSK